jgi:hypothetical protein
VANGVTVEAQRGAAGGTRLSSVAIDRINHLNSALMIGSAGLAFVLPFELLLFAYAVLGPLHYLTEISWLHDRGYFTTGRFDFVPLVVLAALAFAVDGTEASRWGFIFVAFTVLLVTVVHVYVFTGVFILQGSFKSGRPSGFVSLGVFVLCGLVLLLHRPPAGSYELGSYLTANIDPFLPLVQAVGDWSGVHDRDGWIAVGRFLAFAYTYHYLNWFSKTGVIRWHEVSRRRLAGIGVLWVAALALYAHSYVAGLMALLFLSILHVLLEFPLDVRAITDVGRSLRGLSARAGTVRGLAR